MQPGNYKQADPKCVQYCIIIRIFDDYHKRLAKLCLTCMILARHLHWKFFWTVTSSSGAEKINYLTLLL